MQVFLEHLKHITHPLVDAWALLDTDEVNEKKIKSHINKNSDTKHRTTNNSQVS